MALTSPDGSAPRRAGPSTSPASVPPAPAPNASPAADPLAGYGLTIVPHTHWDREWYLPFEVFRLKLARVIDEAMDVLDADPRFTSFTLDGQAVTCEDYAELRPDGVERLRRHLAGGRLVTGPSYVLPDEFLAGPESLVRNLLVGREVTRRFGGEPMAVGYMPDTFGHVAQMPQLLRGFGLDSFVFWRGLGDEAADLGLAFTWRAPDGSEVMAVRQLGGYGYGNQLGRWVAGGGDVTERPELVPDVASHRIARFVQLFGSALRRSGTSEVLVCNGNDHEGIHGVLPDLVEHIRASHPSTEVAIGTYADYVDRLRASLASELPVIDHELAGGRDAPILRGINSSRMYLKQAAERAERAILVAETLASLAHLAEPRLATPADALKRAWREHLRNLPHDSISGCSIDEVHRDMQPRWASVAQLAERVTREAAAALAGHTEPWNHRRQASADVALINPLPWPREVLAEIALTPELADAGALVDAASGGAAPVEIVDRDGRAHARVAVILPGFGATPVSLAAGGPDMPIPFEVGPGSIANEHVVVTAAADGSLTLTDRSTGRTVQGIARLEDVGDRGDEYNFCPVERDRPIRPRTGDADARVRFVGPLTAELEISIRLELPAALSTDRRRRVGRVACPVSTVVRLTAGSPRVEVTTTVENRARDHRLRVTFPAPGSSFTSTVRAEGHFGVVERPARPVWSGAGWTEPPAATNHTSGFVVAGEIAVLGRGLPEYEASLAADTSLELALTLLRCVGWLSRDDLATRPAEAGPLIETPDAQCLGTHVFEYAVELGAATRTDADLLRASADYRTPVVVAPLGAAAGMPGLELRGEVAFSALKPAEDGDGVVLRFFNPADHRVSFELEPDGEATPVRLDETPLETLPGPGIGAGEIRTVRIRPPAS